jgi:hypothetical protein
MGNYSGRYNQAGNRNVYIGYHSGYNGLSSFNNVYMGYNAGYSSITGDNNVFIGYLAGYSHTNNCSVAIGCQSMQYFISSYNTALGYESLKGSTTPTNNTGEYNTASGYQSLMSNTSGSNNSAFGMRSLENNSTGILNTAIGVNSLANNTTGSRNTALGRSSGVSNISGSYNVFLGYNAGFYETGSNKLYIENSTDGPSDALIYGEFDNDFLRFNATVEIDGEGQSQVISNNDVFITNIHGYHNNGLLVHTGYNDGIDIVRFSSIGSGFVEVPRMVVRDNGWVIMPQVYSTSVTGRDVYINSAGLLGYYSSSVRYKKDIRDMENINWLYELKPVNFIYKNDSTDSKQYGLIAEDVEKVNSSFVSCDKNGLPETVLYSQLITPMLKAIQEQQQLLDEKDRKIKALEEQNKDFENRLKTLEAYILNSDTK